MLARSWWVLAWVAARASGDSEAVARELSAKTSGDSEAAARKVMAKLLSDVVETKTALQRQENPTMDNPFVFFHQRKAGGSSVRRMIVASAERHKLSYWVPCFHGTGCNSYDPPLNRPYAIYGGHIYYPSVIKALMQHKLKHPNSDPPRPKFACFTVFREPVSRVESCWDFRFRGAEPQFRTFAAEEVDRILPSAMSIWAEGCNNEPLRILSDSGRAEEKVNTLTSGADDAIDGADGWAIDAVGTLARTIEHMQPCVVGVLERCEETQLVANFYFPWLQFDCGLRVNVNNRNKQHTTVPLPGAVEAVVRRHNALEVLAYEAANIMLDAQLKVVNRTLRSEGLPSRATNNVTNVRQRWRRLPGGTVYM